MMETFLDLIKGRIVKTNSRHDQIVSLIDEQSFLTVSELSQLCNVSEMTIRRDLEQLHAQKRIQRTYGGAVSLRNGTAELEEIDTPSPDERAEVLLVDQVDVLIATSVNPYLDSLLIDRATKKSIPIIAESIEMPNQCTVVAVDNYQAAFDLGCWVGNYFQKMGIEKANLLDLTFHQPNTQNRSHGFADGLNKTNLSYETILSINSQSRYITAYQLAKDALTVYPQINLIFAINDITAWGAINACRDLNIDPSSMTVITFGLEGETLKNELMMPTSYCKAGLAMFPEIVSLTCIEAAIAAFNGQPQPENYTTPHIVLSAVTLPDYYKMTATGWELNWEAARNHLKIPIQIEREKIHSVTNLPKRIGLIVPFVEHEWYKNLTALLKDYAEQYGISLQVIDADQNVRDEIEVRRRQIASKAATLVEPRDVVLVDGGPIAIYLAEELKQKKEITVITNSVTVFDTLNRTPGITLISTGGAVRYNTQMLVGPTAESALRELRADKLFLMTSGITLDFGLSHHTISEVTIKQAMIRSARDVIVLADHTAFGAEVGVQIAPLKTSYLLITDDALPPSTRLEITKAGLQIVLA
ncbi:MAG TPA: DeoR family transcriptional regulator [Anaerolineales bacterium]|nr:DeoR family transcriptional regulator [Anaerolineales bacterium]